MTLEEIEVLHAYEEMQQAMIDKDVEKMTSLVTADKTFTHMSGKTQSKEEFFGEIADGILNYYAYDIKNPKVTVDGDRATLSADTTLTAKVYGISGSWTLHINTNFIKVDDKWLQCNGD